MKKLITLLAICLGCSLALPAQNIWKPIDVPGELLTVDSRGNLYSTNPGFAYSLVRSTDEGLSWDTVLYDEFYDGPMMAVSKQGRVFAVPGEGAGNKAYYSDDDGDTWHIFSLPHYPEASMFAVSNDTLLVWGGREYLYYPNLKYTLDGGATWHTADISPMIQTHFIDDVIANADGDVFVSFRSSSSQDDGIYHATFSDMDHWELAAFPNTRIKDMEFDPEGNVVAVACAGDFNGPQHIPGYYLAGSMSTSLEVADNGVSYILWRRGNRSWLAYSDDQSAHFHAVGDPFTGNDGQLFKGHDNHLYYYRNGSYWKSVDEAGYIDTNSGIFAPQGAEWYYNLPSFMGSDVSYYHMEVLGDTIIQEHRCSIVSRQFLGEADNHYVYEDQRKVYWYNPTLDAFTTLCDFDAEVGDSWICDVGDCSYEIRVDSIDDVIFGGHTYRVQHVAPVDGELFFYHVGHIIDGMGSVEGLFPYPSSCGGIAYDGPYPDFLRCYLVDGEMIYHQGIYACDAVYPCNTTCWDGTVADEYEGGDGTEENPYQIATPQQLALLAQQTNDGSGGTAHYILVDDICLNDEGGTLEWPMIGSNVPPNTLGDFRGVFDGNGHHIKGMYIGEYYVNSGLFGGTNGAVIKNLTVEDSRILEGNGMGIICGYAKNTDFINCVVSGCVIVNTAFPGGQGGIVGTVNVVNTGTDTVFIKDCVSNVRFGQEGLFSDGGGVVGYACAQYGALVIENCVNYSNVRGECAAGIVGTAGVIGHDVSSSLVVRGCKNYGKVILKQYEDPQQYAGGIVGYCWGIEVSRCFNWGNVTAILYVGGIVGHVLESIVVECANMGSVKAVSTSGSEVGGIVGRCENGVVANCYNRGEVIGIFGNSSRANESVGGIVGFSTGSIYNVYNAAKIIGPELPDDPEWLGYYGSIIGHSTGQGHNLNCYRQNVDQMPICGNPDMATLPGSSSFNPGEEFNSWVLEDSQYGTDDLLTALNLGTPVVLDSVPDYPHLCTWQSDEYDTNGGLPMYGFQETPLCPFFGSEWYYTIVNEGGNVTYQHLECTGDTIINNKDVQIIIRTNTLYDKDGQSEVMHEYVYEEDGIVYWWNRNLYQFTVLYNLVAEAGDSWQIRVGTQSLTMHVDAIDSLEYDNRMFRVLHVSDAHDLFSGDIVCGIGHLTSFFPERLMRNDEGIRVEGLRCYWHWNKLVLKFGDEDCDAVYSDIHAVEEPAPEPVVGHFSIYPNPTNGVLVVETCHGASLPDPTYRITNLMGQTLMTGTLTAETQRIDVNNLPQGMYFISVGDATRKFVVQ